MIRLESSFLSVGTILSFALRDKLKTHMEKKSILGGILYPVSVHRQPAYHDAAQFLPRTEQACASVMSLPLHPGLIDAGVGRVVREVLVFKW
jgi:aminotransferase EvaB